MKNGMITVWPGLVAIMREDTKAMRAPREQPLTPVEAYLARGGVIEHVPQREEINLDPPIEQPGDIPNGFQETT